MVINRQVCYSVLIGLFFDLIFLIFGTLLQCDVLKDDVLIGRGVRLEVFIFRLVLVIHESEEVQHAGIEASICVVVCVQVADSISAESKLTKTEHPGKAEPH